MLPSSNTLKFFRRWPLAIVAVCLSASAGAAATDLADAPIGATIIVPANVILDLSVEFPTAVTDAYLNKAYSTGTEFAGYFNPNFCYDYTQNTAYTGADIKFGTLQGYFVPFGGATAHACTGHWSGNFLNWIMTQTIDPLRKTLTGGARIVDTAATTILQKAYQDSQGGGSNQNVKSITTAAVVQGATPFSDWSAIYVNNRNTGLNFVFSQSSVAAGTTTGTSFAGVAVSSVLNAAAPGCSAGGTGTGGNTSPANNTFSLYDSPSTLTVTQGCTNTSAIQVTYGSSFSGTVTLAVSGLPSGVAASALASTTGTATRTLTLTATAAAPPGTSTVTITGTKGGTTKTVTIALTVGASAANSVYSAQSAMQVCSGVDASSDLETAGGRCRAYGSNYKPVGLMQKYAAENARQKDAIRYSAMGYLQDADGGTGNAQLDGGVLRAQMKSVGPYMANPGSAAVPNIYDASLNPSGGAEWSATDGTFVTNPNPTDASATPTDASDPGTGVSNSGVVNYLNKFGFAPSAGGTVVPAYKRFDSVSELYYMATRYYRNLGNLSSHTTTGPAASEIAAGRATNDNFPVITTWDDPVKYSCSPNYIIGVGDQHTWNDGNVPGSTLKGGFEVADTQVAADAGVNATTASNYIGNLEKLAGYTGAGVVPGAVANNGNDYIQTANLGGIFVNSSSSGGCCNGNTFYMAGLAYDVHTRDIRPDIVTKAAPVTVSTFWLDVMEGNDYHEKSPFWMTAKYGGFTTHPTFAPIATDPLSWPVGGLEYNMAAVLAGLPGAPPSLPVAWWNTGAYQDDRNNYAPDQYFQAGNPAAMASGLNSAFAKIAANIPSGTSTALSLGSSTVTSSGNTNYGATFAKDWSGDVISSQLAITTTGGVVSSTSTVNWHAHDWLPNKATPIAGITPLTAAAGTGGRIIATSSAVGAAKGVPFESGSVLPTLGALPTGITGTPLQILNYVRGDQSNEGAPPKFRPRTYTLGDITNSKPVIQAAPALPYADSPLNPGYSAFKTAKSTRNPVVYVGANDGMMHAFDGTTTGGKELFAYVPSFLFNPPLDAQGYQAGLSSLVANPLQHHFMVDAQPTVVDVDFARTRASGSAPAASVASDWHSILISGLGKGGNGYFALDVTDPSSMGTEAALASKVLWEVSAPNMGYSYGTPLVIKTAKYGWTVVLTSGYGAGNADGIGRIYLVSPKDGSIYETISMTGAGAGTAANPAGLAFVTGYINDFADYTADSLYAGDLLGNVWRVDLTGTSGASAFTLLATLADSGGKAQPITTEPVVETDPATLTRYVFVGTGRLLADSDLSWTYQQTFYAFIDGNNAAFNTVTTPLNRSNLAADTTPTTGVTIGAGQSGYYIDLATYPKSAGLQASAERVNIQSVASGGVVTFAANLFGQDACGAGGSRLFALSYGGTSLLRGTDGVTPITAFTNAAPGVITSLGIVSTPTGLKVLSGLSDGTINGVALNPPIPGLSKLNWREVLGN